MARRRTVIAGGQFIPKADIHQVTFDTQQNPLVATVLLRDGRELVFAGEDAEAVRSQVAGINVREDRIALITTEPARQVADEDLPDYIRQHLQQIAEEQSQPDDPDDPKTT